MFNNAVQLASHSLGAWATSHNVMRPAAIMSAIEAIFMIERYSPKSGPSDRMVFKEPELTRYCSDAFINETVGTYCDGQLNSSYSSLCEQLNDADWESLPLKDNFMYFKLKLLFTNWKCEAVKEKLFAKLLNDFRKIASNMGYINPNTLSMSVKNLEASDFESSGIGVAGDLLVSPLDVEKWWNLETSQQRKQTRGALAHEIAHRILQHTEKTITKALETFGITVQSLDDVQSVWDILFHLSIDADLAIKKESFLSESAKQLLADVLVLLQSPNASAFGSLQNKLNKERPYCINKEIETDLLTLRVPEYARGLRDDFQTEVLKCEKFKGPQYCDMMFDHEESFGTHPSAKHRMNYMTNALCEKYPGQNQDICQCDGPANRSDTHSIDTIN